MEYNVAISIITGLFLLFSGSFLLFWNKGKKKYYKLHYFVAAGILITGIITLLSQIIFG